MGRRILTIDLGNSRAKLALLADGKTDAAHGAFEANFETGPGLTRAVETWLEGTPDIAEVLMSSVAPLALEDDLAQFLARRFGVAFRHNPAVNLELDYEPLGSLGRDRVYAARGAVHVAQSDAVVVDAGTALTVDAVRMGETPRFCGGAIAPGPQLLADALHRHTARLPLVAPKEGAAALAHDTHAALQAGIVVGFRGAAAELVRRVAEEAGLERAAVVVVTGGARALLLRPTSCFGERRVIEDPLLVHKGLFAALRDRS